MAAVRVDQVWRMEDLERPVRVERYDDRAYASDVPVDEIAQPAAVIDCARAGASGDEELEARRAERVLDVDRQQTETERIIGGRGDSVLVPPRLGRGCSLVIRHAPDRSDGARVIVRRKRLFALHRPHSRSRVPVFDRWARTRVH
jgi:hypothetical protein